MSGTSTVPLRTGWDRDCPDDDTVTRQAVVNEATRVVHMVSSMGGRTRTDDHWAAGDQGLTSPFANVAVAMQPITDALAVEELRSFFRAPFLMMSAWPTPDLHAAGCRLLGHPPFMLRPAGGPPPAPPANLEITEVHDRATALRFEKALIDGYPVPGVGDGGTGVLIDERVLGGNLRAWIGSIDDRDVSVAAAFTHAGVNQVEMVATVPDARGRGYGAAVTWQATLADPALPAVLIASDDGRSVYEHMGFIPLTRWTLWVGDPSS